MGDLIKLGFTIIAVFVLYAESCGATMLSAAPNSTLKGPHEVVAAEYRLPAETDPEVLADNMTEVWAVVHYPKDLSTAQRKAPLIVMLHGNHATCGTGINPRIDNSCSYTASGSCPSGYVVTPNHRGYDYLAENLASWGYIVVSINANRGITCGAGNSEDWGLNLARGRLVLKHLALLYEWSHKGNAPQSLGLGGNGLIDKIDFERVGLFGHSRGGEGVRAAFNLYQDIGSPWPNKIPGLAVKAIYEVGAVDGQTSRVLDANGIAWNQLLPMCDGDVSKLEGRYPFERMLMNAAEKPDAQKSLYEVWGANHNFFNTEWQRSDAYECSVGKPIFDTAQSGSKEQQIVALASVPAFFRSHLDSENNYNQNFNPLVNLPNIVNQITTVDRDFTVSPSITEMIVVEDFDRETGENSSGNQNKSKNITITHRLLDAGRKQRVAEISWERASKHTFFEAIWSPQKESRNIQDFATLDFRIVSAPDINVKADQLNFSIMLEDGEKHFSKSVEVNQYSSIVGPATKFENVFQTVRIPLSAFQDVDLHNIHGVKIIFNKTQSGHIFLANIRVHHDMGLGGITNADTRAAISQNKVFALAANHVAPAEIVTVNHNHFTVMKHVTTKALRDQMGIEIRVASDVPFLAMDRLPTLKIGNQLFFLSRYSDAKYLKEMIFTLTNTQYQQLSDNSDVVLINGKVWQFGKFKKGNN